MCTILSFPTDRKKKSKTILKRTEQQKQQIINCMLSKAKLAPTYSESFFNWYANFIFESGGEVRSLRVEKQLRVKSSFFC
ncbi:hypothetical protein [Photobacterium kishitanii]|uniref:hypothetical protein n=1 Tax=Photobacterium kishitanii TaxID=318456 RepID=UPI0011B260E0|nr:hypothetical protein [Photobacterium kishitanii]